MTDLIKRLEEAEAGSRELDLRVFERFDLVDGERWTEADLDYALTDPDRTINPPPLTTSLDAALALAERVLPGARWMMVQQPVGWGAVPLLFDGVAWDCPNDPGETVHALLPLALCIAILKATDTGRE